MRRHTQGSLRGILTAAAALGLLSPAMAGADPLDRAASLLHEGRLVEAKQVVSRLDQSALTAEQRERAMELLAAADRRLRSADPVAISLERADLALAEGDVRAAERHAGAARQHGKATAEQKSKAAALLARAEEVRASLAPTVAPAMAQARMDFAAGRYAEAKAALDSVYRSGVRLDEDQLKGLDEQRASIVELERTRGRAFEIDYTPLAVLQPGTVERSNDPLPSRGAEQPAAPQGGASPAPAAAPSQPSEPAPMPAQPSNDLFNEALRFDAQRYLAEADAAFAEARYAEAEQKYSLVTGPYRAHLGGDDLARAEKRLGEARVLLTERTGGLLENVQQTRTLVRQQAIAEYDNFLQQADAALKQGDFERARLLAGRARLAVTEKREVFVESEYNDRIARQEALLRTIRDEEERTRVGEIERRAADVQRQKGDADAKQRADRERKVNEALDRIRRLQAEQKYSEALQVVDQVLFLDPTNPAGLLLKDVLRDVAIYRDYDRIQREKALSFAAESNATQASTIIPRELMNYPPDWPEISFRRGENTGFVDSPEDRKVLASLASTKIPATFTDATLENIVEFVRQVSNLDVDVNWTSLEAAGINRDDRVSLSLRSAPLNVVLDRVLEKASKDQFGPSRASWAVEDGVLVVASADTLRKKTFIKIYDVQDLLFKVPDFPQVPELSLDTVLQQGSQRGGGGSSAGGIFNQRETNNIDQILREEQDALRTVQDIIEANVDSEGWVNKGGDTGTVQPLNGSLIIRNTARNHREIVGLLSQLREVRAIQINVEARFLSVTQDFFEQIGFDLDVYFNAKNNQYKDAVQSDRFFGGVGSQLNPAFRAGQNQTTILPTDIVRGQANNTRSFANSQWNVQSVDQTTGEVRYQFTGLNNAVTAPDPLSIIPAQNNSNVIAKNLLDRTGFANTILAGNPALGIAGTFLDDVQVNFLIEATQADKRNVSLTAPRLTFVNGRFANIFVASQRSFVSNLTPVVGASSVAFQPTVSALTTGVTLLLRGVASSDRRYVTLMIVTRVAQPDGEDQQQQFSAGAGGSGLGGQGATGSAFLTLPRIAISSVATGATIPDQGTILLGGQRLVTESEVEVGVPVLSKIPIINRFFTNRIENKEERTLLILIKPTIILQNEEEEKNFPGLRDKLGASRGF